MTLTLIFCLMTLATLAALLIPLLRRATAAPDRTGFDLAVYRDQLGEVERDEARGLLDASEGAAARIEIERRMLAADARRSAAAPEGDAADRGRKLRLGTALIILIGLPLGAFVLYGRLGSPGLPDQPYAARAAEEQSQTEAIRAMVERLATRMQQTPDDADGWARLAQALRVVGETGRAKVAAQHVAALRPQSSDALLLLAEMQMADSEGDDLPDDALITLRKVLTLDPDNVQGLYYVGLADARSGDVAGARGLWTRLLGVLPADSPDHAEVQKQLDSLPPR